MKETHCIIYRIGGTDNFRWHRSSSMTKEEAFAKRIEIEKMGYKAITENYQRSISIGLPEGYEYDQTCSY